VWKRDDRRVELVCVVALCPRESGRDVEDQIWEADVFCVRIWFRSAHKERFKMSEIGRSLRGEVVAVVEMLRWTKVGLRRRTGWDDVFSDVAVLDQCAAWYSREDAASDQCSGRGRCTGGQ